MGEEKNKYGIEETLDLVEFAGKLVDALAESKSDDGKIDGAEIATTLVKSAPAAVSAIVGAGDISKELKELSDEERQKLVDAIMPILIKLTGMFIEVDS